MHVRNVVQARGPSAEEDAASNYTASEWQSTSGECCRWVDDALDYYCVRSLRLLIIRHVITPAETSHQVRARLERHFRKQRGCRTQRH